LDELVHGGYFGLLANPRAAGGDPPSTKRQIQKSPP
jgi:hypothetical protein